MMPGAFVCCIGLLDDTGRAMVKILKRLMMLVRKRPVVARLPDMHIV
jgi:hypothetical protein